MISLKKDRRDES